MSNACQLHLPMSSWFSPVRVPNFNQRRCGQEKQKQLRAYDHKRRQNPERIKSNQDADKKRGQTPKRLKTLQEADKKRRQNPERIKSNQDADQKRGQTLKRLKKNALLKARLYTYIRLAIMAHLDGNVS